MLDQLLQTEPVKLLPVIGSLFAYGFFSSPHCSGMCSPIASLAKSTYQFWQYQLGRLLGYLALGVIAGMLGHFYWEALAEMGHFDKLGRNFAMIMGVLGTVIILMKIFPQFSGNRLHQTSIAIHRLKRPHFLWGLITIFLPCHLSWSFLAGAAATRLPGYGALIMLVLWISTTPALVFIQAPLRGLINRVPTRVRSIAENVVLGATVISLFIFSSGQ